MSWRGSRLRGSPGDEWLMSEVQCGESKRCPTLPVFLRGTANGLLGTEWQPPVVLMPNPSNSQALLRVVWWPGFFFQWRTETTWIGRKKGKSRRLPTSADSCWWKKRSEALRIPACPMHRVQRELNCPLQCRYQPAHRGHKKFP